MKSIKSVTVAVAFALALFALPSAAVAQGGVEADSYPVIYEGVAEGPVSFSAPAYPLTTCSAQEIFGTADGPTNDMGSIDGMTCNVQGKEGQQLQMNGCEFEFHPGSDSSVEVGPPGCGPIANLPIKSCNATIPAQAGIPASYANVTDEGVEKVSVTIDPETPNIEIDGCPGYYEKVHLSGEWLVTGYESLQGTAGPPVDIRRGDALNGFFITGKKSESEAEQPRFTAESFPNPLTGSLEPGEHVVFNLTADLDVDCNVMSLSGNLTAATKSLPVGAALSGCTRNGTAMTVQMNSCRIAHHLTNTEFFAPLAYQGKIGIDCTKEGDYISLQFPGSVCQARIPAQNPSSSSATYTNLGSGTMRHVRVSSASASQLTYTFNSGFCLLYGEKHANGALSIGKFNLLGI